MVAPLSLLGLPTMRLPRRERAIAALIIALIIGLTLRAFLTRPSADDEYRACLKEQTHVAQQNGYRTPDTSSFKIADEICMHPSDMSAEEAMAEWRGVWALTPSS
jgi:hypothetical protein